MRQDNPRLTSELSPPEQLHLKHQPVTCGMGYAPLILIISLIFTAITSTSISWIIKKKDSARFDQVVENLRTQIAQQIESYTHILDGTAGLVASQERIDRHTLQVYIDRFHLREKYPGIQGIGWSVRVPSGSESDLLSWFHAQGFTHIPSLPINPSPPLSVSGVQTWTSQAKTTQVSDHHAIALIEPLDAGNLQTLGYDMSSIPIRSVAMQAACDQNRVVATDQTTLLALNDSKVENGFVLFIPVYKGLVPPDLPGRRAALSGYIFAPLRDSAIFSGIPDLDDGPLVFSISDTTNSEPPHASTIRSASISSSSPAPPSAYFFQTHLRLDNVPNAWLTTSRNLSIAGRTWTINACSTPVFEASSPQYLVPWVATGGILLSFVLFTLTRAHARAVIRSSKIFHQCMDGQHTARINLSISQRLARSLDLPAVVQSVVDGGCELTGASFAAFVVPNKNEVHARDNAPRDVNGHGMSVYAGKLSDEKSDLALPRVHALLAATIDGQEVIRLSDVRRDARYKNDTGGTSAIISYLAVPVSSRTNQAAGCLVFSHPTPGHFTADHERLLLGLAAQAAIAIDNAQLFQAESATRKIASQRSVDLIRVNAELQQFAYVSSHDLQEPLRTVTQYLDLLRHRHGSKLDVQALRYIDYASDSAARMYLLLNDLLTYSRLGREAEREPVPLQEVWDDVCADLRVCIDEVRAETIVGDLPTILCERSKMRLVIQNLLANALKFHGRAPPRCSISAKRNEAGIWVITVADNGIGIDPEHHARIFEVFERLHHHDRFPGTGIGLAICRKVIEQHGGRIWVESTGGDGSSFHFSIPDHSSQPLSKYLPAVIIPSHDVIRRHNV